MRLLHTSDWHLGRSLHRADLHGAQAAFLDHLVATVRAERVDAVLVAGDVYDRALPPVEAVELCSQGLRRLRDAGARVVLTSGNHDSAKRLGFGADLIDTAGVHLRTRVDQVAAPVLLEDAHGPVAVYGIPYLEPAVVGDELPDVSDPAAGHSCDDEVPTRSHAAVLGRALAAVRADLAGRPGTRSVAMAHGWVIGGIPCESERVITAQSQSPATHSERKGTVGGVGAVSAALFDGVDYAALGHLHGPQTLAPHLRYSGSPLAYSFSEARHTKGSWLVELGAAGLSRVEFVEAPVERRLSAVTGTLAELLADPAFESQTGDYVTATLTDTVRPAAAMERLRARFAHILVLSWEPLGAIADTRGYAQRVRGRSDLDIATDFVAHVRGAAASEGEAALLERAFESVRIVDDADPYAKPLTLFDAESDATAAVA